MDSDGFFTRSDSGIKKLLLPLGIAISGLMLIGYGLISSLVPKSSDNTVSFSRETDKKGAETKDSVKIAIDVAGSVTNPAVYSLKSDARVQDAIDAAGGFSETADKDWVAKHINLAKKLTDAEKVYVPALGEVAQGDTGAIGDKSGGFVEGASTYESSLININSASDAQLDTLPGVGTVTVGKITNGRPYSSIEELVTKKIVTQSVFEKIKDQISAP